MLGFWGGVAFWFGDVLTVFHTNSETGTAFPEVFHRTATALLPIIAGYQLSPGKVYLDINS